MKLSRRLGLRILRWGVVLGVLVGIILAVAQSCAPNHGVPTSTATVTVTATPSPSPTRTAAKPTTTTKATPTSVRVVGVARGCLGGPVASQAAVEAQKTAALTPEGAAEFAAAVIRWGAELPTPAVSKTQVSQIVATDAPAKSRQIGNWPSSMQRSTGYASFLSGRWDVDSFSLNEATVTVLYKMVVSNADSGTQTQDIATRMHLRVEKGHWHFVSGDAGRTPAEMLVAGTPFSGGC